MRDSLIELVKPFVDNGACALHSGSCEFTDCRSCNARSLADRLLANGVIVPPVSIGDSLWNVHYNRPREWKVVYLGFNGEEWHINVHWHKDKDHYCTKEIDGKYVDRIFFRTKEEAERALKDWEEVLWT